ncbi:Nonribosomal peptide synthetase 7 [Hondaea fermentalgiana]|uniref:Nonribosomal peptide synthetase 7 n=1 Tax=Hondaea fermentalgiana TaxID=2315210 RepID=A0A2R5G7T6_9STRA|nr:Nonribosomal peptide synthetase 7 [Hondaea fermentalgiana]|eukprot:GBG26389.1 Nonribosomal peptide synthetase 7 [Hondaea fermentalgiana]
MAMRTVVEAVATQSRLRPTAVAVYSVAPGGNAREISYEDLWTAARALAGLLRDRLAERGEEQRVVAVGAVEDAELVVVQLAVLLAGMIYCPVDLADPRCGAVLEDANAQLLVHGACDSNARTEALPDFVPTMREVSLGGEPMPESIAQAARTTWPARCRLVNIYGVTEATVYQCLTDVGAMGPGRGGEQVIAAALEGIHEIVLGGKQVARGYLHQDCLTAERFFTDANAAGIRCFRTGDMGRLEWIPRPPDIEEHRAAVPLPCSCGDFVGPVIRLLGRQDHQIKLRGVRIEIGEIEAHVDRLRAKGEFLEDFALVKHAKLDQLVLWIALSASAASRKGIQKWDVNQVGALPRCVEEAVRVFLRRHVTAIMIPGRVAAIKSFDHFQSPNGKRDMQRIRNLSVPARGILASQRVAELSDASLADASRTESATTLTSLEALIASIWSKRLGVNPAVIGPWDSFASIGGDSLEAQRVTHELVSLAGGKDAQIRTTEESFGEFTGAFSVANLLTAPCLRAYASILAQSSEAAPLLTGAEVDVNDECDRNASRPIEDAAQHALFVAVTDGLDDAVRILVDPEFGGLDPDAGVSRERRGKSPLHVAAAAGHAKVVRVLLEAGANIFATTNDKVQAAHIAASAPGPGGTESFRLLLEALRARGVKKPSMLRSVKQ